MPKPLHLQGFSRFWPWALGVGPHRPLPCHSEQRWTAAMAPVRALCQIEQMPWGPERPVKCLQVSQEVNGYPRGMGTGVL